MAETDPPPTVCPGSEQLQQWLDGTLPESEQAPIAAHVEACEKCQRAVEELAAGRDTWQGAVRQLQNAPEGPTPRLREVIEELRDTPQTAETHIGDTSASELPLDFLESPDDPQHLGKLDHYEVIEVVGRGAFGTVLRAFDQKLHRVVAIKVMSPQLASSITARKRFIREGRAAAGVCHEHVITIHAVEEDSGPLPYLVMQFVQGVSLQERLDRRGPPALAEILRIGMQAASGLAAAHAQGIVHRDIKPANILLENGVERVKITDFGLARAADDASLTQSGVIAGTPQYMAPEQARGDAVDHRADLFSLGSVLYTLCAGRPPFRASTTLAVLKRVCEEEPRPIREINPEIPEWLSAIITKLHAKDPAERFQSAKEVSELLAQHLAHVQQPGQFPLPVPVELPHSPSPSGSRVVTPVAARGATGPEIQPGPRATAKWFLRPLRTVAVIGTLAVLLSIASWAMLLRTIGVLGPATAETAALAGWTVAWIAQIAVLLVAVIQRAQTGAWARSILGSGALVIVSSFAALDVAVGWLVIPAAKYRDAAAQAAPAFSLSVQTQPPSSPGAGRLVVEAEDPRIRVEVIDPYSGPVASRTDAPAGGPIRFDRTLASGRYNLSVSIGEEPWIWTPLKIGGGKSRRIVISPPDSDWGRLQGRWIVISKEGSGTVLPADFWSGSRIEFAADEMRQISVDGVTAEGRFAINTSRDPKEFDYMDQQGNLIEQGIYRLEGDTLTLCLGPTQLGKAALPRPDEFRTRMNSELQLYVCRRAQRDTSALQGLWNVVSEDRHGQMSGDSEREARWEFKGDHLGRGRSGSREHLKIEVENGSNPKQMDLFSLSGTQLGAGIYQIEDGRLIVCMGTPGRRPTVFPARAPAGQVVTILARPGNPPASSAKEPHKDLDEQ